MTSAFTNGKRALAAPAGLTAAALVLAGERIKLISVKLDGMVLKASAYVLTDSDLTLANVPAAPFTLEIETECDPVGNTELAGL